MKSNIKTLGCRIDLNLLVVFDAIHKSGNLGSAGAAIGLSPSAMSHALARLRVLFKDPLYVRLPRGLKPTPLAVSLAPTVAHSLASIRGVFEQTAFDPATSVRVFSVAMTDVAEYIELPALCAHLARAAPGVSLETCQPRLAEIREAMAYGEIDLLMGVIPELEAGFRERTLVRSSYVCMVREDHPRIRKTLSLRQFRETPHVLVNVNPSTGAGHARAIEQTLRDPAVAARIAVRNAHFLALPGIILNTDYIATLPRGLALSFQEQHRVSIFAPPVPMPDTEVKLYWHDRYHREPGNAWLRDVCVKLFQR